MFASKRGSNHLPMPPIRGEFEEDISLQEVYKRLFEENSRENRLTEHPVEEEHVVEMTLMELCQKYDNPRLRYLVR